MIRVYLVNEDNRGCIFAIEKNGKEIGILIYTKEGMKRGGHYHKSRQHTIILKGSFMVKTPNREKVYSDGDHIVIDANIPHLFTALEDTLAFEYLEGEIERTVYPEYRKEVEECM